MPKHKSAEKRLITSKKANARNRAVKSRISTLVKKTEASPTEASLKEIVSLLDRASRTGAIHANKASRIKSRLTRLVHQKAAPTSQ
ncbi:MAG: 30S ribosomal protein S20 [candidate division Zixibacteria bacterium]|nr:30S ribosomal protein S20 [candidate division Zixibacteria bacterium]